MNKKWKFEGKAGRVGRKGIRGLIEVSSEADQEINGKILVLAPKSGTKGADVELKDLLLKHRHPLKI